MNCHVVWHSIHSSCRTLQLDTSSPDRIDRFQTNHEEVDALSYIESYHSITALYGRQFGYSKDVDTKQDLFVLPGLLGYGDKQIEPLRETLVSMQYRIIPISYVETAWKPELIAAEVAALIKTSVMYGRRPTIFGVSLGGLLAGMIARRLTNTELKQLTVIAVDSPYGVKTLKALSRVPAVGRLVFGGGLYGVLKGKPGNALLNKMRQPPKPEFIEVPGHITSDEERELYKRSVMNAALEGLADHSWETWGGQLDWMVSSQTDLSALKSAKRVLYIQCRPLDEQDPMTPNNNVVVQPLAMQTWQSHLPGLETVTVPTDHCAFLEASVTWNKVIRDNLGASKRSNV